MCRTNLEPRMPHLRTRFQLIHRASFWRPPAARARARACARACVRCAGAMAPNANRPCAPNGWLPAPPLPSSPRFVVNAVQLRNAAPLGPSNGASSERGERYRGQGTYRRGCRRSIWRRPGRSSWAWARPGTVVSVTRARGPPCAQQPPCARAKGPLSRPASQIPLALLPVAPRADRLRAAPRPAQASARRHWSCTPVSCPCATSAHAANSRAPF